MIRYAEKNDLPILQKHDRHISEMELKNSIEAGRVLILTHTEHLIGWLRYNLFWDNIPFMNMLYVLEGYRGNGYGRQLVDFWEKEMLKKRYKQVLTSTLSNERAQFFYRKNGYVDCGSLLLPGEPLEIILLKHLDSEESENENAFPVSH
jgi:GNAT superfamily N-acetyltransferase